MPTFTRLLRRVRAAMLVAGLSVALAGATAATLVNPGFEGRFDPVPPGAPGVHGSVANGWADNSAWADVDVTYARETAGCHAGTSCQKVTVGAVRSGFVEIGQPVDAVAGRLLTPGFWVRGLPGARIHLWLAESGAPYRVLEDATVDLSESWQFASVPVHVTRTESLTLWAAADRPATFWLDDAALDDQPGAVTPRIALPRPGLSAFGMHIGQYLQSKGPFDLDFEGAFLPVAQSRAGITGLIAQSWSDNSDWADVTVDYRRLTRAPHGGAAAQRVVVSGLRRGQMQMVQLARLPRGGSFTVRAWVRGTAGMNVAVSLRQWGAPYTEYAVGRVLADGTWQSITATGTVTAEEASAIMIQAPSEGTLDVDDVQLLDASGQVPDLSLPWPSTPVGTWRLWDQAGTTWSALEPVRGRWNFDLLDRAVDDAAAHGAQVILTLGQTPTWASARPDEPSDYGQGASAEPRRLQDWADYLRTVATRYRGRIFLYEVWNEPNDPQFYSGSVTTLVTLTQVAAQVLRKVDPRNRLIGAPAYSAGYLQSYLAAGAAAAIDIVGFHIYNDPPEDDARLLADLRSVAAATGVADKPLWITEGAAGGGQSLGDAAAAGLLARKFLVELIYGSSRLDWYTWGPATPFCLATTQPDLLTPTPAGLALAVLQGWIVGATIQGTAIDAAGNWSVEIAQADASPAYLVWNPAGPALWTAPAGFSPVRVDDLFGASGAPAPGPVPVGTEPLRIVGKARR